MSAQSGKVLSFGPFELSISNRLLTNGSNVVPLGARAMDTLIALAEQPGEVLSRRNLIERVWPGQGADEGSLRVQISALRKALALSDPGGRYVTNVPGRGYSFIAPVTSSEASESTPASKTSLPARLTRMVGRQDVVATVCSRVSEHKFMTIVGPGGIGKTTVAVAAAHDLNSSFDGRVRFIDFSPLGDASLIVPAVAALFGVPAQADDVLPALIAHLRGAPTLLVLDGCEHLIEGVAALAEKLFVRVPTLHLLATSREAMRVEGEHVHELAALMYPPEDRAISASHALEYAAVQLLVDRIRAVYNQFVLQDVDAPSAASICRRLDGIALAIELAAGTVDVYGLGKTASMLDEHLNLSWAGRRTAMPRHQTLNATLEWSYELLGQSEKLVLDRLSVFSGGFTLESAMTVLADGEIDESLVSDCVWELRSKSMIAVGEQGTRLRLLDSTRAFASRRLAESREQNQVRRRHAFYFLELFEQSALEDASNWPKMLKLEVDNLRAALTWAFSDGGDSGIGVELAAASASTWMGMALLTECREWMAKAAARFDGLSSGTRQEMIVQSALASCMMFTGGMTEESYATWARTHHLAEGLGDVEHQLVSLLVLWAHRIRQPRYAEAVELAEWCGAVAEKIGDRGAIATANYMRGISLHHVGRLQEAENCLELSLFQDDEASRQALVKRFGYDRKTDALMILSNVKWLRGSPDHARRLSQMSITEARQLNLAVPLCVALTGASFDAYLMGPDDDVTDTLADELVAHARKHHVDSYHGFGQCVQALRQGRRGEFEKGEELLHSGLEKLSAARYGVFNAVLPAQFALCLADAGRIKQAITVFEQAKIDLDNEIQIHAPELLRIRGELAFRNGEGTAVFRQFFQRAIELADRQGSLSWSLRAATSLAMAEKSGAGREGAREILRATYAKFHDGLDTFDLTLAARMLADSDLRDDVAGAAR